MDSGSSGRTGSGSKEFDFGSDDVLCSYEDFEKQEPSNTSTDSVNPKDFWDSRMARPLVDVHNQQDEFRFKDMVAMVEKTMKKYADNLLRFLEGISGRLSQLEVYCHNLERSIGELRSDLTRDHNEADMKLRSLEKHLQEVHRSIQILRDKQELADTQKELAKLQLVQKESTSIIHSHQNEDGVASSVSEPRKHENSADLRLALALPQQVAVTASLPVRAAEQQHQPYKEPHIQQLPPPSLPPPQTSHVQSQSNAYCSQQTQLPIQPPQAQQHQQDQLQYVPQRPQVQDLSRQAPLPQPHVNQTQTYQYPSYQQQWPQQFPQQLQPQEPSPQSQIRPQPPTIYPPYPQHPANQLPESFPGSIPMQVFSGFSQSGVNRPDAMFYGYGGPGRTVPQQPAQHNIQRQPQPPTNLGGTFGAHASDRAYPGAEPHPPQSNISGYMMYDTNTNMQPHPPHYQQGSYPPTQVSAHSNQQPPTGNAAAHPSSQPMRNHPYGELVEKAVSMGYTRDHVLSVILRMEESGQPFDFNAVLDGLNTRATGASQRVWSG
ncbi:uncharacterized protein LOC143847516 [Tasmannia lanceolata]|uniref:uncharacterized protein LOC143847516 n=1 Tax=Tasmannia lanceolata TaxID=3420 RepID=UPI004062B15D